MRREGIDGGRVQFAERATLAERAACLTRAGIAARAVAVIVLALLAGCASASRPAPRAVLDAPESTQLERETAPYRAGGTATIAVQVMLETPRGRVTAGEGTPVTLMPATTWAIAAFRRDVIEGDRMPELVEGELVWHATTDADGRAVFRGLAAGDYLIASPVGWRLAGEATYLRTDVAHARVRVAAGEEASAVASRTVTATLEVY